MLNRKGAKGAKEDAKKAFSFAGLTAKEKASPCSATFSS